MAKLVINENKTEGHINPEIYGHFSEHLGRCIYEGLYVRRIPGFPMSTACGRMLWKR